MRISKSETVLIDQRLLIIDYYAEWPELRREAGAGRELELGSIGFVFSRSGKAYIHIILLSIGTYVDSGYRQIGFVLHN